LSKSKIIVIITFFLNVGVILINVGPILINVEAILTGVILQWGDLTRYQATARERNVYVNSILFILLLKVNDHVQSGDSSWTLQL
jgi:hypothetical protein